MFHTVRDTIKDGTYSSKALAERLGRRLPPGWSIRVKLLNSRGNQAFLEVQGPRRTRARIAVVAQKRVIPKALPAIVEGTAAAGDPVLVTAPFLSPRARELLVEAGASYADATGNLRLALSNPPVFIETEGASRDPSREPRPLKSLKGARAGRVIRALCDFAPSYGVRELSKASGTALGTVSRVVDLLDQEALITRGDRKRIVDVDWEGLLRRWSRDHDLKTSNKLLSFIEPRGLSALTDKFISYESRYAVTGSLAVPRIAPARLASIYVDDIAAAAEALGLTPTDTGANVWLLEPYDDVVFERIRTPGFALGREDALVCAAPSQVAVDLLTSPGRSPQEAEALLESMRDYEDAWRHGL